MRTNLSSKTLTTVIFLVLAVPFAVSANQDYSGVNWIITGNSPTLDKSTNLLARGNVKAGIRYARKAMHRSRSPLRDLIASHNLCLGLMMEKEFDAAADYCGKLKNFPETKLPLVKTSSGNYKVSKRDILEVSVNSLIAANLALFSDSAVAQSR